MWNGQLESSPLLSAREQLLSAAKLKGWSLGQNRAWWGKGQGRGCDETHARSLAHLEATIVEALLANENRLHRRLHVGKCRAGRRP
jgi:hypothetical protein